MIRGAGGVSLLTRTALGHHVLHPGLLVHLPLQLLVELVNLTYSTTEKGCEEQCVLLHAGSLLTIQHVIVVHQGLIDTLSKAKLATRSV